MFGEKGTGSSCRNGPRATCGRWPAWRKRFVCANPESDDSGESSNCPLFAGARLEAPATIGYAALGWKPQPRWVANAGRIGRVG